MQILATIVTLVWIGIVVVGIIGLVRGRLRWARIGNRKTAGWVLAASIPLFILIGVVAPKQDSARPVRIQAPVPSSVPATIMKVPAPAPAPSTSSSVSVAPTTTTLPAPPPVTTTVQTPPSTTLEIPAPPTVDIPTVVPAPAPAPSAPPAWVTPGAFCSTPGATGRSKTGKPMVCETTPTDSRLRWRQA